MPRACPVSRPTLACCAIGHGIRPPFDAMFSQAPVSEPEPEPEPAAATAAATSAPGPAVRCLPEPLPEPSTSSNRGPAAPSSVPQSHCSHGRLSNGPQSRPANTDVHLAHSTRRTPGAQPASLVVRRRFVRAPDRPRDASPTPRQRWRSKRRRWRPSAGAAASATRGGRSPRHVPASAVG